MKDTEVSAKEHKEFLKEEKKKDKEKAKERNKAKNRKFAVSPILR